MCDCKVKGSIFHECLSAVKDDNKRPVLIATGLAAFFIGLFLGAACSGSYPETVHYHSS